MRKTIVLVLAMLMAGLIVTSAFGLAGVNHRLIPWTFWPNVADYIETRDTLWFDSCSGVWSDAIHDSCEQVRSEIDDSVLSDWSEFLRDSADVVAIENWNDSAGVIFRHDGSVPASGDWNLSQQNIDSVNLIKVDTLGASSAEIDLAYIAAITGINTIENINSIAINSAEHSISFEGDSFIFNDGGYGGSGCIYADTIYGDLHGNASTADSALHADHADHADQADTAGLALTADYADTAGCCETAWAKMMDTLVVIRGEMPDSTLRVWNDSLPAALGYVHDTAEVVRGEIRDTATVVWNDSLDIILGAISDTSQAYLTFIRDSATVVWNDSLDIILGAVSDSVDAHAADSLDLFLRLDGTTIMDGGVRYWGQDATLADSFWIFDDGDTTRFNADNPIKIGNASLIVGTDGKIYTNDISYVTQNDSVLYGGVYYISYYDYFTTGVDTSIIAFLKTDEDTGLVIVSTQDLFMVSENIHLSNPSGGNSLVEVSGNIDVSDTIFIDSKDVLEMVHDSVVAGIAAIDTLAGMLYVNGDWHSVNGDRTMFNFPGINEWTIGNTTDTLVVASSTWDIDKNGIATFDSVYADIIGALTGLADSASIAILADSATVAVTAYDVDTAGTALAAALANRQPLATLLTQFVACVDSATCATDTLWLWKGGKHFEIVFTTP